MVESIVRESELPASMQDTGSESCCGQASSRLQVGSRASQMQVVNIGWWDDFSSLSFTGYKTSSNGKISACFAKGESCFQPALIFSYSLSVYVRICFLLQQRSIANYTFEEGDLRDSVGNQRKQGYTSHCILERVNSHNISSFQAMVRCAYYKPVSYKANRIMRK